MFKKLPPFTKNFYFLFGMAFLVWMLLFDSNDFYSQFKLSQKQRNLERDKEFYLEKIEEVKKDRKELLSNKALLEKFAREKYLMKKDNEDVYVIVDENKEEEEEKD